MSTFPFLDFFAGSGLVTEALKQDFRAVWANDICPKKARVYQANHGDEHFVLGSVQDVHGADLPEAALSWASFPCQDLSLAGNLKGIDAERSGLVWNWLRTLDEMSKAGKKPPIVVAENVVGLVSGKSGAYYRALHHSLRDKGYVVGPVILNANQWVPQSRPRVFVIGVDSKISCSDLFDVEPNWGHPPALLNAVAELDDVVFWKLPKPRNRKKGLCDVLESDAPYMNGERARKTVELIPERHMRQLRDGAAQGLKAAPGYKRIRNKKQVLELRFDDVAGCLRTPKGGSSRQFLVFPQPDGGLKTRLLTVRETARLMGAADTYKLPGANDEHSIEGAYNEGYMAMGDAVAVPVARFLSIHILSKIAAKL